MTSLIDRYVAAAADDFPSSDNDAIARDVRGAVEDMVEANLAQGMNQENAERAAIEELGDPRLFAEQFQQEPRYLIGPKLFRPWWNTLRLVMAIVVPLFIALGVLENVSEGDGDSLNFVIEIISSAFEGVVQAAFWVTLFFAIFQFTGGISNVPEEPKGGDDWSADDLPDLQMGRQITISHLVMSLVSLIGATYLAVRIKSDELGALGLNHLYDLPPDTPAFNAELSRWWAIGFFTLLVISLLVSIWSFARGYWTRNVLVLNLLDNALWLGFLSLLGNTGRIINPAISQSNSTAGEWDIAGEHSNDIIIGIALIIVLWAIYDAVKGHFDYRKLSAQRGR